MRFVCDVGLVGLGTTTRVSTGWLYASAHHEWTSRELARQGPVAYRRGLARRWKATRTPHECGSSVLLSVRFNRRSQTTLPTRTFRCPAKGRVVAPGRPSTDDFVSLISKVIAAGHGRTAAKLRSYLHAAYALAIRAKTNPDAPQAMRMFGLKVNPVASIDALSQYNKALNRNLSTPELAAFLKHVRAQPADVKRDALEMCIFLGGQRPTQLLRLRRNDVDLAAGVITLYDFKGRRRQPRLHVLLLTQPAAKILERRIANLAGNEPVFSTNGRTPMDYGTLTNVVTAISAKMVEAHESNEPFTLRDHPAPNGP